MDTAFGKGKEEGIKEGLEKGIKEGLEKGKEEGIKEGLEKGMEKGIKEGLEKGKEEANRSTVLKMKLRGFSLEDIAAITSLPLDEIEKM